jgi:DNA-binding transcriptional ArsR family regulator
MVAFEPAAELLKALAHPVRLAVVRALSGGPRCVHELVELAQVSQPLLSQHLRVLRAARLISGTRRGKEIAYRLTDDHVGQIAADAVRHAGEQAPTALASPGRPATLLPKDT